MDDAKHTPIPWQADIANDGGFIIFAPHMGFAGQNLVVASRSPHEHRVPEMRANAELIVRAVNAHAHMLALLKELIDIEGPCPGNAEWAHKVRAAISKAEGR